MQHKPKIHNIESLKRTRQKLRKGSTTTEQELWYVLRNNRLGYKFRRQQSIGRYIVDFYCPSLRLVIEVDGNIHGEVFKKKSDSIREAFLVSQGLRVCRYHNEQIRDEIESVTQDIINVCSSLDASLSTTPDPSFPRRGTS